MVKFIRIIFYQEFNITTYSCNIAYTIFCSLFISEQTNENNFKQSDIEILYNITNLMQYNAIILSTKQFSGSHHSNIWVDDCIQMIKYTQKIKHIE